MFTPIFASYFYMYVRSLQTDDMTALLAGVDIWGGAVRADTDHYHSNLITYWCHYTCLVSSHARKYNAE
jgi:hypothetical protein